MYFPLSQQQLPKSLNQFRKYFTTGYIQSAKGDLLFIMQSHCSVVFSTYTSLLLVRRLQIEFMSTAVCTSLYAALYVPIRMGYHAY